jgi:short-subunit dehydrogenase
MVDHWLILGATSSMARAFAREVATTGAIVSLAGRDLVDLEATAADTRLRGARDARVLACDATDAASRAQCIADTPIEGSTLNVLLTMGSMPDQDAMRKDPGLMEEMLASTLVGPMHLIEGLAPVFLAQKRGCIIIVGSVAGDRGRVKNYLYGAAKAGLATYADGLRARLFQAGTEATVTLVKPGFVDTAMTWGLSGLFLMASPQDIARAILKSGQKGAPVLYFPGFWRLIMLIIQHIPRTIMKRLAF